MTAASDLSVQCSILYSSESDELVFRTSVPNSLATLLAPHETGPRTATAYSNRIASNHIASTFILILIILSVQVALCYSRVPLVCNIIHSVTSVYKSYIECCSLSSLFS